jgi:AAA+ ATPase superfamily predicted ATPase
MIIQRPSQTKRIREINKWILVYGRRKTGKSFLVENFIDYDDYFFVKRDRSVISKKDDSLLSYETFLEVLKRAIAGNKTVVVDEFHRLGNDFFDFLHSSKKQGKVILISSTLFLSKKLISDRSPLLGLFAEVPIGLIDIKDSAAELTKHEFDKKSLTELSILLKEPLAIDYFEERKSPRHIFTTIISASSKTVPSLIGEVFVDEERGISATYEAILRAIANGDVVSSEISSYLFSRKLIQKNDPSIIQQYLNNLVEFGIIKKLQIYGKNRFIYKHISPLARLFYYADEKYNISEKMPNDQEIRRIIDELMPKMVEDHIREFIADNLGLGESILEAKDYDIDGCLTKFNKCEVALEVKWKEKIGKDDVQRAEEVLYKIAAKRRLLFVPDKKKVEIKSEKVEIVDIRDFI